MVRLDNWSVCSAGRIRYTPPELQVKALQGNAFGHPRFEDGKHVVTSSPFSIKGRIVTTYSGSVYKLGKIDPEYRKWLKKNVPGWNWRNPITIKPAPEE